MLRMLQRQAQLYERILQRQDEQHKEELKRQDKTQGRVETIIPTIRANVATASRRGRELDLDL